MIAAALCMILANVFVDPPTPESIAVAAPADRPLLIEARLSADRQSLAETTIEQGSGGPRSQAARAKAALQLCHDLLTLGWSRTLAPERVLLGVAIEEERATAAAIAGEVLDVVEPMLTPGSPHRSLLPYRAAALTMLAALGDVTTMDAQVAWQGVDMRRQPPRLVRLAAWAGDASGDLRFGSDCHSLLVKQGVLSEQWLAQLNKRMVLGQGQWPPPESPWQVMLLAEARAHAARDVAAAEALLADALPRLVAGGWSPDEAAALLADRMAIIPAHRTLPFAGTALARAAHAAAMVTRGNFAAWSDAPVGGAAAPWTRVAARRAARGFELNNQVPEAMQAWAGAGLAGDTLAARRAAAWVLGLDVAEDDHGVIDQLRTHKAPEVALIAKAASSRRAGRIDDAVRDWVRMPPGTRLQAGALAAAASQLGSLDLEVMGTTLQRLRAAAAAAATDTQDPVRAAMAMQASGWALAALVDHTVASNRVEQAARLLAEDPAVAHLSVSDALRLRALVALRQGNAGPAFGALVEHDVELARGILLERALAVIGDRRGLAPDPRAADEPGLRAIMPLLLGHLDTGQLQHQVLVADALRLLGRGDVDRYRDILEERPALADAMLGLAELLASRSDEADRIEAMSLYRALTHAAPEASPDRWWLAQLRMLQLALSAGRPTNELRARVERLRHGAPMLGGIRWSGPIQATVQSSN